MPNSVHPTITVDSIELCGTRRLLRSSVHQRHDMADNSERLQGVG